jgi:hypothetical protein
MRTRGQEPLPDPSYCSPLCVYASSRCSSYFLAASYLFPTSVQFATFHHAAT